jgi:hypothetical protein
MTKVNASQKRIVSGMLCSFFSCKGRVLAG